ncbi:MAG: 4'-phosphopantetheinyl transferase superfamily protein [bacterium]
MGIIIKNYLDVDTILGIWEITEDYNSLMSLVNLNNEDHERLNSFRNHKRKLEWLSVRALATNLAGKNVRIIYNENRKPLLEDNSHQISISHSNNLTSILLSKKKKVGIDLEYMSHRISSIAFKFINEREYITRDPGRIRYHLYVHWCAKEAMYKICDKQDINFKKNLTIKPFHLNDRGQMEGIVSNIHGREKFNLSYFKLDNYAVAWCIK